MKSQTKRELTQEFFRPLKSFRYNPYLHPYVANNKQMVLTKNLHRSYGIAEGNVLRLIMYADIVLCHATGSEIKFSYSDLAEVIEFEKNPTPIDKIVFTGDARTFEITNSYLIGKLHCYLMDLINSQEISAVQEFVKIKRSKKEPSSEVTIKKVATELFNELTRVEKISDWRSYCIIGYIFCLYKIDLKPEGPILSEDQFNLMKKDKQIATETYLQYLAGRIKQYVNN